MWRNLIARKFRLLASAFAIVLGVAFVAGSFIFTDTIGKSFDSITEGTVSDVLVRPVADREVSGGRGEGFSEIQKTIEASLVDTVASVDGVDRADGAITGVGLYLIDNNGKLVGGTGAPTLSFNVNNAPNADGEPILTYSVGEPPGVGEIALDSATARNNDFRVGQTITLITPGDDVLRKFTLVGIADPTGGGSTAGANLVYLDTADAQAIFFEGKDVFNEIGVTGAEGVTQTELAERVGEVLPEGYEAITGEEYAAEVAEVVDVALGFLNTFLLVFAAIALVVGTFLIINTFSILVAQRSKELALLRALGASKKQITRSVLYEAFATGLIGSAVGVLAGVGLAAGLKAFLGQIGLDLSRTALEILPRTFAVSFGVGIFVTLIAAYVPARRASSIPPIAAMRDEVALPESALRRRIIVGALMTITGAALMILGLNGAFEGSNATYAVGGGVLLTLIGVSLLSPVLAKPVLAVLGAVFQFVYRLVGRLATQNAARNPRRTAATASALMIGLALVSTMTVLGASVDESIRKGVEQEFQSDLLVSNATGIPFSTSIADDVLELESVGDTVRFQSVIAETEFGGLFFNTTNFDDFQKIYDVELKDGEFPAAADEFSVSESYAKENNIAVGDILTLGLNGQSIDVSITGIYADSNVLFTAAGDLGLAELVGYKRLDTGIAVNAAEGATPTELRRDVEELLIDIPIVTVQNQADFIETQLGTVGQILNLIYGLLALAVVIAILGIVNTLALSVLERTREIGLLRAVGLSRTQLRRMIRLEAVAISILGAVLGVAMGLVFGVVLQRSLADDGIDRLAIPVDQLVIFVAVAAVVGILAAVLPAFRAARLNVLAAISTE